jgi:hypothetical protein
VQRLRYVYEAIVQWLYSGSEVIALRLQSDCKAIAKRLESDLKVIAKRFIEIALQRQTNCAALRLHSDYTAIA